MTDLKTKPVTSISGLTVHGGFHDAFKSFRSELMRHVQSTRPKVVHCVGHSLGGALANLAAETIADSNLSDTVAYSFGSPRVGTEAFARKMTNHKRLLDIFRVYHGGDPVSMVP